MVIHKLRADLTVGVYLFSTNTICILLGNSAWLKWDVTFYNCWLTQMYLRH